MKHATENPLSAFGAMQNSASFLNFIVQNTNSAVILLDKDLKLHAYNESVKAMFGSKSSVFMMHKKCGDCLGCANAIEEGKSCGNTSKCLNCELRKAVFSTFISKQALYKQHLVGDFYNKNNHKERRSLQYSVKPVEIEKELYVALLIEEISLAKPSINKEHPLVKGTEYWVS